MIASAEQTLDSTTIAVRGVGMDYRTRSTAFTALDDVNLQIPSGGFTTLLGPSGCGKSTLLRIISDILEPSRGSVELFGMSPSAARRSGAFGFVFQDPVLLPWRSARANVELPLQALGISRAERRERAMDMLKLVGLNGFEENLPAKLSGGMSRRVAIARALIVEPRVLLLDEPFNGLDELRRRQMNEELLRIWSATKTTALLVTHNVSEAVFLSDEVVVMGRNPGCVIATRAIELERPRSIADLRARRFRHYEDELSDLLVTAYGEMD